MFQHRIHRMYTTTTTWRWVSAPSVFETVWWFWRPCAVLLQPPLVTFDVMWQTPWWPSWHGLRAFQVGHKKRSVCAYSRGWVRLNMNIYVYTYSKLNMPMSHVCRHHPAVCHVLLSLACWLYTDRLGSSQQRLCFFLLGLPTGMLRGPYPQGLLPNNIASAIQSMLGKDQLDWISRLRWGSHLDVTVES